MSWCEVLLAGQRRYFSEKARSRLRGNSACLTIATPALLVRVPGECAGGFLLAHCQVGFAVMFIIGGVSFFCVGMKKARGLWRAWGFGWGQSPE